ncbi:MAG: class I SAM-dependent methyltransferase [Thermodesulfobacteriota bacterium]
MEGYPAVIEYKVASKQRYGYGKPPHPFLYEIINKNRDIYKNNLETFLQYKEYFYKIPLLDSESSLTPFWLNEWLPSLDAMSLYAFLCRYEPKTYLEVGSGNSTKFARTAINNHRLKTKIISLDPHPRAEIDQICDDIIRQGLEEVDLQIFEELEENDVLFIDNSHRCFMNSDVTVAFLDVLPRLKSNVLVHFHDIFLPYDYLPGWEDRYFSEQYLLAAYLLANTDRFKILQPNFFIANDPELMQILNPILNPEMQAPGNPGASFWIKTN